MQTHSVFFSLPFNSDLSVRQDAFPLDAAPDETEITLEAMRRMLRIVLRELTQTEVEEEASLETLIAGLLGQGVTIQEIAFLIAESQPLPAEPIP